MQNSGSNARPLDNGAYCRLVRLTYSLVVIAIAIATPSFASDGVEPVFTNEQLYATQRGFDRLWESDESISRLAFNIDANEVKKAVSIIENDKGKEWSDKELEKTGEALATLWIYGGDLAMEKMKRFYARHDRLGEWFPGPRSLISKDPGASPPMELSHVTAGLSGPYCDIYKFDTPPVLNDKKLLFESLEDELTFALFKNGLLCADIPNILFEVSKKRKWVKKKKSWSVSPLGSPNSANAVYYLKTIAVNKEKNDSFVKVEVVVNGSKSTYRARLVKDGEWKLTRLWDMTTF